MSNTTDNDPFGNSGMQPVDDDGGGRALVWALLGIVALGCGLLFAGALFFFKPDAQSMINRYFPSPTVTPSSTPTLTPTSTPTPTNTPTPTPNSTATAIAQQAAETALANQVTASAVATAWKASLVDTFDSNKHNWLVNTTDDEYSKNIYTIADGVYKWDVTAHQPLISWNRVNTKQYTDFYLSIEIHQTSGPDSADYGVVFREDADSNFYYFGVDDQGQYSVFLYLKDWKTLQDWTPSDLIHPGEVNRLTVVAESDHFIFFINNEFLTEITDNSIPKGQVGLAVELAQKDDQATFEFDNVDLQVP